MAYCVHCGVKLGQSEASCPLCGTEAHDPAEPFDPSVPKPFPVRTLEQTLLVNRRYAVSLLSLLLLVPAALCVVIDLLSEGISWSIYPAGVLVLIWIAVTVPLLMKKHRLYSTIVITTATLAAYLYMIAMLSQTESFLPIALPSLALSLLMTCFTVWLIRSKRLRLLRLMAVIFMEVGILCFVVELLCVYAGASAAITWSPFVIMPCFFLALLLYVISRNGPLSSELKRRFHF